MKDPDADNKHVVGARQFSAHASPSSSMTDGRLLSQGTDLVPRLPRGSQRLRRMPQTTLFGVAVGVPQNPYQTYARHPSSCLGVQVRVPAPGASPYERASSRTQSPEVMSLVIQPGSAGKSASNTDPASANRCFRMLLQLAAVAGQRTPTLFRRVRAGRYRRSACQSCAKRVQVVIINSAGRRPARAKGGRTIENKSSAGNTNPAGTCSPPPSPQVGGRRGR